MIDRPKWRNGPMRCMECAAKSAEIESLREMNDRLRQKLFDAQRERKEARRVARKCWWVIYEAGERVITDDQCTALSEKCPWLEVKEASDE